uniref:Protein Wnt n=2 Tax=Cacopsylla melanoneura TaxID=428564 RepID=A0A8D8Q9G2_9HEMI
MMPALLKGRLLFPDKFLLLLVILATLYRRSLSGSLSLGASIICARIPGLSSKQREMCVAYPDLMAAIGSGVSLGLAECQTQFRLHRWNCSATRRPDTFGHVVIVGSREAAYTYAVTSAGVTYAITSACSRGNISNCGCEMYRPRMRHRGLPAHSGVVPPDEAAEVPSNNWKWGGCSVDIGFAMKYARKFLDAREIEGDARSLMNLHNNKAGRKMVKTLLQTECKCHGVSGSCTMKTCWRTLPPFKVIGDALMKKYHKARGVSAVTIPSSTSRSLKSYSSPSLPSLSLSSPTPSPKTTSSNLQLALLKRSGRSTMQRPRRAELVYLEPSPNYCERDLNLGSLGTVGRHCNRTSRGMDGCDLMCCGRGYNTHQISRAWQCRCKFHWCCYVQCDTCSERIEVYTCK